MNIRLLTVGTTINDTFKAFGDNYLIVISDNAYTNLSSTGGGVIGIFFSWLTTSFSNKVVSYVIKIFVINVLIITIPYQK